MSPEALALGLLSAGRASVLAVVYALLLGSRPRRLLVTYIAVGLTVSLVAGLISVTVFDGASADGETTATRYAIDLVLGIAALVYAGGYGTGRFGRSSSGSEDGPAARILRRLRNPTVPAAALAGAATNLPGLYYIAALVAILEIASGPVHGAFQVLVYNVLRFAMPITALVLVVFRPARVRTVVEGVFDWGRRHQRVLVVVILGAVGAYLVVKGTTGLLGRPWL